MQFRQREDLPAYDEIDLNPTARDLAQKRLERLARIEFILWRMTRGELPEEVAARLAEHDRLRAQLVDKVERIRAEVAAIDTQVVRVANLLLKHVADAHLPAFRERLRHAAVLKEIGATLTSIPVSRLDDVIPVLKAEFNRIVETEPSSAGVGFAPPAGADDDVQKTIEHLHRQIASLRALVPLCAKSMEVQSERLRDLSEKLEDLWDETLRFAICIGLAAPYSSCKRFFGLLGLRPRIGVDFNLWLGLAFPMVLLFVLAVLYLSGKLPFAGGPFATWKGISDPERPVWLILGLFFICWPLLQGCYVGSALAHGRQAESGAEHHDRMRPQDYLLSFLMIWSVLVLGVSLLIAICGFSGRFPFIYVQALAYAPVSALWGVLVSAAALRALDPRARGGVIRGREVGGLLLLVAVGVKLAEAWIASELSEAQGGAEVPGGVLMGLALGLSAVLSGAIWVGTSKGVNGLLERWQPPRLTGARAAG
ncbi:hypothetical protein BYZ73_10690 [Rhodovulum viride]|uniref:Uncharacterized protein n=1 Tax=Rhodovulum viride TaxID=1231134 RepID=A0ABX9DI99_9RHOB|nr:hypothetical protein [Rhodovulum viride]RAP41404.1 hypothetical protein BYZ73_10690 [Rhodovulum viride]